MRAPRVSGGPAGRARARGKAGRGPVLDHAPEGAAVAEHAAEGAMGALERLAPALLATLVGHRAVVLPEDAAHARRGQMVTRRRGDGCDAAHRLIIGGGTLPRDARTPLTAESHGPPAIVLGQVNALSVIRSLGRRGVAVTYAGEHHDRFVSSRYAFKCPCPRAPGRGSSTPSRCSPGRAAHLEGAVLPAVRRPGGRAPGAARGGARGAVPPDPLVAGRPALPAGQALHLRARGRGGSAHAPVLAGRGPRRPRGRRDELVYPVIVKPHASNRVSRSASAASSTSPGDLAEARDAVARAEDAGLSVMLVERIVAPDTMLRSYYTWIDHSGEPSCTSPSACCGARRRGWVPQRAT